MAGTTRRWTAVVLVLAGISGVAAVDASAATKPKPPKVTAFTASPAQLGSDGGSVTLAARVTGAKTCVFSSAGVTLKKVACATGRATTKVSAAANASHASLSFTYKVTAVGVGKSASRSVIVTQAGVPIPPLSVDATTLPGGTIGVGYTTTLTATGGTPSYTWSLDSGSLPAGLTLGADGTIKGTPTAAGTSTFTAKVTDQSPSPMSATKAFSITVVLPPLTVTRTTFPQATVNQFYSTTFQASGGSPPYTWAIVSGSPPAGLKLSSGGVLSGTPTTAGLSSFTARVTDSAGATATAALAIQVVAPFSTAPTSSTSTNWSGYFSQGGGFTSVKGTFNVPSISANSSSMDTSIWVGVDGVNNANLIQAGVAEDYSASAGRVIIYAWWEILPAFATPISSRIVSPAAGDQMTISISQQSPGQWAITVSDDTRNQTYSISQSYNGELTSAEWIVEAATDSNGNILTLAPYSPDVTFTNLAFTGSVSSTQAVRMVQSGSTVSTPSTLSGTGFRVAYGSSAPSPP